MPFQVARRLPNWPVRKLLQSLEESGTLITLALTLTTACGHCHVFCLTV